MTIEIENKSNPKYSIVTPSYNSFRYMCDYWKSLENQTYDNFEIIIVDDCSQDDTYVYLEEYVNKSTLNIRLLKNQKNYGPGYSRNRGISEAKGEWITFIDSDDSVDIRFFEEIENVLNGYEDELYPIQCIVFDYSIVKGNRIIRSKSFYGKCEEGLKPINSCIEKVRNHVIGKVYKTEKIKKIKFPELRRCEDVAFVYMAIDACCMEDRKEIGRVYYIKKSLYNYIQRQDSLSNDESLDETDMIKAYEIIREFFCNKYADEISSKAIPDLLYGVVLMKCKARKSRQDIMCYISEFERRYPNWYRNEIINEVGAAKKLFLFFIRCRLIKGLRLLSSIHSKLIA